MGTYSVKANGFTLAFKPAFVDEVIDEESMKIQNKKAVRDIKAVEFVISHCKENTIRLEGPTGYNYKFGSRVGRNREVEVIKKLKQRDAWKMLSSSQKP
jgi:hypothetical protein